MPKSEYLYPYIFSFLIFLVSFSHNFNVLSSANNYSLGKNQEMFFPGISTESLSVPISPLRASHKFQLLFHSTLFSILESGCCIKDCRILFYFILYLFFLPYKLSISIWYSFPFRDLLACERRGRKKQVSNMQVNTQITAGTL